MSKTYEEHQKKTAALWICNECGMEYHEETDVCSACPILPEDLCGGKVVEFNESDYYREMNEMKREDDYE